VGERGRRIGAMAELLESLNYYPPAKPVRELTLTVEPRIARVEFPIRSMWAVRISVALNILTGAMKLAAFVFVLWIIHSISVHWPVDLTPELRWILVRGAFLVAAVACFWWLLAAHEWRMHRRFGHIPRSLTADESGITRRWTGWRSLRERHWLAAEIIAIELQPQRGVHLWGKKRRTLVVRRAGKRPLRFALPGCAPSLPPRIVEAFSAALRI